MTDLDPLARRTARKFLSQQEEDEEVVAVAPPGWEGPVKDMKKDKDIDNPWALAWYMKNKGDKPHKEASLVERVAARFLRATEPVAMEHDSPEALKKYLHEHPNADPSNHTVKGKGGGSDHGPAEAEGPKGQARFDANKKQHGEMKALLKKVENADPSAKKKFDAAYDKMFENGEKAAGAAKKLLEKYSGNENAENALHMLESTVHAWENNKLDHHKAKGAVAGAKMRQGTETYAHAQNLESFVKDFHKFLKDPDAHVDDSWRGH